MIIDVRFLPRVGERLEIGYRKTVEILVAGRFDNDKRYDGFIKVRSLNTTVTVKGIGGLAAPGQDAPKQVAPPVFSTARQAPLSGLQGAGQSFGDLSVHELARIARELDKAKAAGQAPEPQPEPEPIVPEPLASLA